jgi:hypothetical protein
MSSGFIPGLSFNGPVPDETLTVRHGGDEYILDVVALTSNYRCIYGEGCQGTTPPSGEGDGQHLPADKSVTGCCRTAVRYRRATAEVTDETAAAEDSPRRVQPYVDALRPDEAQHYDEIAAGRWYREEVDGDGRWKAASTTVEGNCVFLNTEMDNGRTGCALYHLAGRLGLDPRETRPFACHTTPLELYSVGNADDGTGRRLLVTLRPHWFGWFDPDGYFCTNDPAAFSGTSPVYLRMASELSMLLGPAAHAAIRGALDQVMAERGERLRRSWGTPVALAPPTWARYQSHMRQQRRLQTLDGPAEPGAARWEQPTP